MDWTKIYKKYKGLWVALDKNWKLVSYDKDIKKAHKKASAKGFDRPIMFKVPTKNTAYFG